MSDEIFIQKLKEPRFWLVGVAGEDEPIELAAFAPDAIDKNNINIHARKLCKLAEIFYNESKNKIVFINDLSHFLTNNGKSWADFEIDWEAGFAFLMKAPVLGLYIATNETGAHLASGAGQEHFSIFYSDGVKHFTKEERNSFRKSIEDVLSKDWPSLVEKNEN